MQGNGESSYRRFLQGDKAALEELVCAYSDKLVRYACCFVRDIAAAEDIAEDAFVALIVKRRRIRGGEAGLKAYLFKTARNRCYDYLRRTKRQVQLEDAVSTENPETLFEIRDRDRILYAALKSLPPQYRDTLYLAYFEDFPAERIATVLGRTKKQVYNLLARAKAALRQRLERENFHENV